MNICDALRNLVLFVQIKKRENTHGGVLLFVKLQDSTCNFIESNTPPWKFLTFFKLYSTKLHKASHFFFFVKFSNHTGDEWVYKSF